MLFRQRLFCVWQLIELIVVTLTRQWHESAQSCLHLVVSSTDDCHVLQYIILVPVKPDIAVTVVGPSKGGGAHQIYRGTYAEEMGLPSE